MKKILFLAVASLATQILFAQQADTKKVSKKASKKVAKVTPKTEVKVETPKAVDVIDPAVPTKLVTTPDDGHNHQNPMPVAPAAPQVDVNKVFEFTNDNYDFGKIVGGKAVEYTLTIKNVSKSEAELTTVQATCGCTTPKFEPNKKFAPGESVTVTLGFNGGSPSSAAPFSKTVNITLNGNLTKSVTFRGETYVAPAEPAPSNPNLNKF